MIPKDIYEKVDPEFLYIVDQELYKVGLELHIRPGWWGVSKEIDWNNDNRTSIIMISTPHTQLTLGTGTIFFYKIIPYKREEITETLEEILLDIPEIKNRKYETR